MVAAVYRPCCITATRHSGAGWGGGVGGRSQSQLSQGEGGVTAPHQVTSLSHGHFPTRDSETVIHAQHHLRRENQTRVSPCFTSETDCCCKTAPSVHTRAPEDCRKASRGRRKISLRRNFLIDYIVVVNATFVCRLRAAEMLSFKKILTATNSIQNLTHANCNKVKRARRIGLVR